MNRCPLPIFTKKRQRQAVSASPSQMFSDMDSGPKMESESPAPNNQPLKRFTTNENKPFSAYGANNSATSQKFNSFNSSYANNSSENKPPTAGPGFLQNPRPRFNSSATNPSSTTMARQPPPVQNSPYRVNTAFGRNNQSSIGGRGALANQNPAPMQHSPYRANTTFGRNTSSSGMRGPLANQNAPPMQQSPYRANAAFDGNSATSTRMQGAPAKQHPPSVQYSPYRANNTFGRNDASSTGIRGPLTNCSNANYSPIIGRKPAFENEDASDRSPLIPVQVPSFSKMAKNAEKPAKNMKRPDLNDSNTENVDPGLRVLSLQIKTIKDWASGHNRGQMILFEVIGRLDSSVTMPDIHMACRFTVRDDSGPLPCIFYQIDREMPRMVRGQTYRLVGKFSNSKGEFQCIAVRQAAEEELRVHQLVVNVSQKELRNKLHITEF